MTKTTKSRNGAPAASKERRDAEVRMPLGRKNYICMLIGVGIIILMSGGGSDDPNVFDYSMFSFRRITLAPVVVLAGFGFEIFAIMKKFKE